MKRVLSLVLVLMLVLTSIMPAFAEETAVATETADLQSYGVVAGDGTGANEEGALTRAAMTVLLAKLYGKQEEAAGYDLPGTFEDLEGIWEGYVPYINYAKAQGWMVGDNDTTFRPMDIIKAQEMNSLLLRALGYTVEEVPYADANAKAEELGFAVVAADPTLVLRGEGFKAIRMALDVMVDGAEDTLGTSLALTNYVAPVVEPEVPETLEVVSITALNTKQIEVKFNKAVDATKGATAANYTVGGVAFGNATIQEDGMTVVATMAAETAVTNATEVEFKVLKAVGLEADYAEKITVVDTTSPQFVSVKAVGSKTLELTFSEPVVDSDGTDDIATTQFTVKSGIYTYVVSTAKADYTKNTITLTLGTNLLEGDVTVKYNALGMSDADSIRDFAGLVVVPATTTYAFATDTTVATAELTSVNKETKVAKVTFSKPVHGDNVKLYHSVNGTAAYATAAVSKTEAQAATEWTFTFTNALPSGTLNFFLVNDTVAANQIADLFGVKVPNQTFTFDVVADTEAPTVSKVTVNTNASIDIDFSEAVPAAEVKAANFEILKADGTAVTFTPSAVDADTVRLTATLTDNTTYTVNVLAMNDAAGNAMAAVYTTTVTVADNENPTLDSAYFTDTSTLYLVFSEDMDQTDLANKNNYVIDGSALTADDTVTVLSGTKVKITIDADDLAAAKVVQVGAVKDIAGKKLTSDATFATTFAGGMTQDALTFTAELTGTKQLKIKFNKELSLFDAADFSVAGATFLAIESNSVVSGKTEVVLTLDTALAADATPNVTSVAAPTTKSTEGTVVAASTTVAAADKIAPTFDKVVFVNDTTIEVQLTEDATAATIAAAGTNGFSVTGGTLTTALKGTADNVIILTGTDFTINTDVTYTAGNITDAAATPVAMATQTMSDALTAADLGAVYAGGTVTLTPNYEATALDAGNDDIIAIFAKPAANVGSWFAWVKEDPTFAGTTALTVTQTSGTTFTVVATGNAAADLDFTIVIENEDGVQAEIALTAVSGGTVINAQ
jgi:hypothetical protein